MHVVFGANEDVAQSRRGHGPLGLDELGASIGVNPAAGQRQGDERHRGSNVEPVRDADVSKQRHGVRMHVERERFDVERLGVATSVPSFRLRPSIESNEAL